MKTYSFVYVLLEYDETRFRSIEAVDMGSAIEQFASLGYPSLEIIAIIRTA
jgi:hypothetical protein